MLPWRVSRAHRAAEALMRVLAQVAAHLAQKPLPAWREAEFGTCESSSASLPLERAVVQKDWTDLPLLVVAVAAKALAGYHFLRASSG